MENPDAIVFQLIGEEGFDRLTHAFYARVATDDILPPMYPADDLEAAHQRLRDFLIFRFGGPAHYIERRGHPKLRARHIPFAIDGSARNRWVELMESSLTETNLPPQADAVLREFFGNTATFLINRGSPPGRAGFAGNPAFPVVE